ncbi:MAG: hypothetical protein AAGI38_15295, partial [Bacteroidota bacterium]
MNLSEISKEIVHICTSDEFPYKKAKDKLNKLFDELRSSVNLRLESVQKLIYLHKKLSEIRDRKASYIEEEIARLILVRLAFKIRIADENIPEEVTENLSDTYQEKDRDAIKMSAELLKYGKEIVLNEKGKLKRHKKRVKEALRLLDELQRMYAIDGLREIFLSKINDKDEDVQFHKRNNSLILPTQKT